jgi:hypothetical protein
MPPTTPKPADSTLPQPKIVFGPSADSSSVKPFALEVIKDLLRKAGEASCTITSTARTPAAQANAMYRNIVGTSVKSQKDLYGHWGDLVIDQYVTSKKAGKTPDQIKADMTAKIIEIGPANVSRHCADFNVLCVVDIAPSSIQNKTKFVAAFKADKRISKYFLPPTDPAYHLEIPV